MAAPILEPPVRLWGCECGAQHRTQLAGPHTPLHPCPLAGGVAIPYAPAGREHRGIKVQHWDDYQGLDERNLDLARERVGMFLTTDHPFAVSPAA